MDVFLYTCVFLNSIIVALAGKNCFSKSLVITTDVTVITSPDYPEPYKASLACSWSLNAHSAIPHAVLKFQVLETDLDDSTPCYTDEIEIVDGPSSFLYPVLVSWCGNKSPKGILTTSRPEAELSFSPGSEKGHTHRGFKIHVWAVSKPPFEKKPIHIEPLNLALFGVFAAIVLVISSGVFIVYILLKFKRRKLRKIIELD